MTPQTSLLPCPFCGDAVKTRQGVIEHPWRVGCPLGRINFYTSEIEAWNTREAAARIEGLTRELQRASEAFNLIAEGRFNSVASAQARAEAARKSIARALSNTGGGGD